MSVSEIQLQLNPKQELALTTKTNRLLLSGGIRAGKTTVALIKVREIALRMPGSQILVMRATLKEIRDDLWKSLYNPNDGLLANSQIYGKLNKSNYEHNFHNGSKIIYRQADDPKKLLGLDLSAVYFEQAENIDKRIFEYALGRLTHWGDIKNPNSRGYRYIQKYGSGEYADSIARKPAHFFILSCNPDTGSWIYDDLIRTCEGYDHTKAHIKHKDLGWDIINFQTTDNAQLPDVNKYIEEQRLVTSDAYFRRMIMGEWLGSEGMVWSHFNNEKHIISDFIYEDGERYEIVVGIDPGSAWYTGIVFMAYDKKQQTFIIFDEIKVRNSLIEEVAELIKDKLTTYKINKDKVTFLIDHAANAKESSGISKADQYRQNNIIVLNANKILEGGLERINGLFKQGRIKITGNCINLLNDIKSYYYDEDGKPNKRVGPQAFDLADAFRYCINHYAFPPVIKDKKPVETDSKKRTAIYINHIFQTATTEEKEEDSGWGV